MNLLERHRQVRMLSLVAAALVFMYAAVLSKLASDWWTDDNYSHGILIPFLIGFILWQRSDALIASIDDRRNWTGWLFVSTAVVLLLAGTLASVLYAQRLSLLVMVIGVAICIGGTGVIRQLVMPLLLFFLAIPVPQILFNKIAFPLQLLASRIADLGMRTVGIPASRMGNLIEIPNRSTGDIVSLEVVEACSGIRSLVTLIALALVLGYFTRDREDSFNKGFRASFKEKDVIRTFVLMVLAVPVALITNAARVMLTGVVAHFWGQDAIEGLLHDLSGSAVFVSALILIFGSNVLLKRLLGSDDASSSPGRKFEADTSSTRSARLGLAAPLVVVMVVLGLFVNWMQYRGELQVDRRPLVEIPSRLGGWEQRNPDIRFDAESEKVLRATDYVMRDYYGPGKRLNVYVGYYETQRGGSTYHSPLNCLPGTGWEMTDPQLVEIETPSGSRFTANLYIVSRGEHQEYLIYWYQGRGRRLVSEYEDKLYTAYDSVVKRRSDGGMVRVMTPLGKDPARSLAAAFDLTGRLADNINEFLPD